MTIKWLLLAGLTVAACGSKKQAEPAAGAASGKDGSGSATVVTSAELFPGTTVALPTPAAKLTFGMPEAAAKAAAPEIFAAKYGYEVPGTTVKYESIKLVVQFTQGRVWSIRLELLESQDSAKAWLAKKWGEPVVTKNAIGTPEYYWNAPAVGLRAKLEQRATASTIYFSAIMPLDALLGTDPKHLAFDNPPLVGATPEVAMKALAAYQEFPPHPAADDPGRITIPFLPVPSSYTSGSSVDLRVKDGKVTGWTLGYAGDAKDTDALVARLEAIYGKGKVDDNKLYTDFSGPPPIKAEIRRDDGFNTTVWFGDYRK